jgi:hypothetical protein
MNMFSLATSLCRLPSRSTLASTCTLALGSHRSHPLLCFTTLLVAGLWIMEAGLLGSSIYCKSPILVAQLETALHYTTHDKVKHVRKVFQSHMTLHFLFNQRSFGTHGPNHNISIFRQYPIQLSTSSLPRGGAISRAGTSRRSTVVSMFGSANAS